MLTSQKTLISRKSNRHTSYYGLLRGIVPAAGIPIAYAGRASTIATSNGGSEDMGFGLFILGITTTSIGLTYFYYYCLPQLSRWWQANRTHKSHGTDKVQELQEGNERELELEEQSAGRSRSSMSSEWPFWSASVIFQKLNPKWIFCFLAMSSKPAKWKRDAEALSMEEIEELLKKARPDYKIDRYGAMLYSAANVRYMDHQKKLKQESIENEALQDDEQRESRIQQDDDDFEILLAQFRTQIASLRESDQQQQQRLDAIRAQVGSLQESSQEHWQALDGLAVSNREHWQALDGLAVSNREHWQALDSLAASSQENRENLEHLAVSSHQQQQELNSLEVTVAVIRADVESFVNREMANTEPNEQNAIVPQPHRNRNWLDNFLASRNAPRGHNSRGRFPDQ